MTDESDEATEATAGNGRLPVIALPLHFGGLVFYSKSRNKGSEFKLKFEL